MPNPHPESHSQSEVKDEIVKVELKNQIFAATAQAAYGLPVRPIPEITGLQLQDLPVANLYAPDTPPDHLRFQPS